MCAFAYLSRVDVLREEYMASVICSESRAPVVTTPLRQNIAHET